MTSTGMLRHSDSVNVTIEYMKPLTTISGHL